MEEQAVRVAVPATTANLGPGLDVLGMALDLYNNLELRLPAQAGTQVEATGEGAQILSRSGSRLLVDAVRLVFARAGFFPPGLHIRQHNVIPLFRGLGSSAAAVAGGVAAANALLPEPLPAEELLRIAVRLEGHPDNVTPALFGGFTAACQWQGKVKQIRVEPPDDLRLVVAVPAFALPTHKSRGMLPKRVELSDAVFNMGRVALWVAAMQNGDLDLLVWAAEDRMHQTHRGALVPGLADVIREAKLAGAKAAALSGAGPSVVAFAVGDTGGIGEAMEAAFLSHGVESRILIMAPGRKGALACTEKIGYMTEV